MVRDFEDSTLWRISAFDRVRLHTGSSGFARLEGPTLLSTTLLADLRRLDADPASDDVLEVVAACMRHREAALLCLQHEELVWPVTLFPADMLYHSPRDLTQSTAGLGTLKVLTAEPPGVRPPGDALHERVAFAKHYRPLRPLLWALALHGPRKTLLAEIGGTALYRMVTDTAGERPVAPGALGSAIERMARDSVSLRQIASWPGMSVERASRLLNGLYLVSSLMTTRSHAPAGGEPSSAGGLFGFRKSR